MADVISVSDLNHYVKTLLDVNDGLFDLALRGEIANFVQNARSILPIKASVLKLFPSCPGHTCLFLWIAQRPRLYYNQSQQC